MKKVLLSALLCAGLTTTGIRAQEYVPSAANLEARKEFQDEKFGIFIHWGVYSMLADGEWNMNNKNINRDEYAKLPSGFYPSKFNAAEWVAAIKVSGAKYITITSRHHDGFSMFDTKQSDYNIVKATPFKRDVLKELADECHKQGIKLHFYYSHLDWYRDDYPVGRTGRRLGRDLKPDWNSYYSFMNNQITELLTNYGPVGAIWFDGWWDHDSDPTPFNWHLPEQYALIHRLQPSCLVGNNHHQAPFPGEDIQIFERDLPGENTAGLSGQSVSRLPLETCQTMNGMWGYRITDRDYKSTKTLIQYLVKAAGMNANLLLNIGPQPNGELPAVSVERMKEMGEWLHTYGETIYGTRGGIVPPRNWGVTTQKDNILYVHIMDLQDKGLFLPIAQKVSKAVSFKDKKNVRFKQNKDGVLLELDAVPEDIDYIVEITLKD